MPTKDVVMKDNDRASAGGQWIGEEYDILADVLLDEDMFLQFEEPKAVKSDLASKSQQQSMETEKTTAETSVPSTLGRKVSLDSSVAIDTPNQKKRRVECETQQTSLPKQSYVPMMPVASTSCGRVQYSLLQHRGPRRPEKGNAELEKFLKAATIAAKESSSKRPSDNMTSEQELVFRRERNRVMAKQTRERKKVHFKTMQDELKSLQRENEKLKLIVKGYVRHPKAILKQCTAMSKIPKEVWESFGCSAPQVDLDDDDSDSPYAPQIGVPLVNDPTGGGGSMLLDLSAVLPTISPSNPFATAMKLNLKGSSVVSDENSSYSHCSTSSSVPNPLDALPR